ncbi:hypothetical protein KIN20_021093 [Parelaphostrongylus tenuis]|uniref:Uncharacterized protein n=1 Tax=Parelaphostrongylus tenuis TaxID=148309 RepID=A0AAD5MTP1_PARTN|nr:hypothetical protein KIN20_021093 [Parelaphostrongylus tenuis]
MTKHKNSRRNGRKRRFSENIEYEVSPKLDELQAVILPENMDQLSAVELRGFDDSEVETEKEYVKRREEVRHQLRNPAAFDANGRTELNYDDAAVAGAKLLIDETRATRNMCKKLMEDCGINEDEILYKPLSYDKGTDYQSAKHGGEYVLCFLVKFDLDELSKSDRRLTRRAAEETRQAQKNKAKTAYKRKVAMRTPIKNPQLNPLDEKKVGKAFKSLRIIPYAL